LSFTRFSVLWVYKNLSFSFPFSVSFLIFIRQRKRQPKSNSSIPNSTSKFNQNFNHNFNHDFNHNSHSHLTTTMCVRYRRYHIRCRCYTDNYIYSVCADCPKNEQEEPVPEECTQLRRDVRLMNETCKKKACRLQEKTERLQFLENEGSRQEYEAKWIEVFKRQIEDAGDRWVIGHTWIFRDGVYILPPSELDPLGIASQD
jgi:hypothetical protein